MDFIKLGRELHDLERLREIVTILVKKGFGAYLSKAKLLHHAHPKEWLKRKKKGQDTSVLSPALVRESLEALGPTFVKPGQVLSLRQDLVPPAYCEEFKKLQDDVAPIPHTTVQKVIEAELGKPITRVFASIEKEPLAAASIGQVHKAKLKKQIKDLSSQVIKVGKQAAKNAAKETKKAVKKGAKKAKKATKKKTTRKAKRKATKRKSTKRKTTKKKPAKRRKK